MKVLAKHSILLLLLLLLFSFSYAQNIQFIATTNRNAVNTGDRFQIEFKANANVNNFAPPNNLSNFRILSGPNQSTSMSWVNGKTNASISFSYVLMAVKEGEFTINPASVNYNGKSYKSNTIKINVGKGVNVQQQQANNQLQKNQKINTSKDIFIKALVNKTKVYQGEQIIATYKVYTRLNIAGAEPGNDLKLNGFWKKDIDLGQVTWRDEIINGVRWKVAILKKMVLFPQRSGKLELDPYQMKFVVQKRVRGSGNGFFDQFFSQVKNENYTCKSKPVKITVLPLPKSAPEGFDGAVGHLSMKVNVSTNEVKANEAVNIKIKISGAGNLSLINELPISFPKDFETYDPKINDNIKTTSAGLKGSKEFNYLIIPRHAGKFDLGTIKFSYFNPSTKKYKTIISDPITINVLRGEANVSNNISYTSNNKEDISILGEDIRFIHNSELNITHSNNIFYGSFKFYFLFFLAPFLFIIILLFRNKIREIQNDVVGNKKKKAGKIASKFLSSAKTSLVNNNKNEFYESISKALFGYVGDKLNISKSELNRENIKENLTKIKVSEQTTNSLIETIDLCDMARFAPVSLSEQEIYDRAATIINKIEDEI